jgi:hypothetical protein
MRLVIYAVIVIASLPGSVLAQSNTNQPPAGTNVKQGITAPEAPVGHRQPKPKDLPANVLQNETRPRMVKKLGWSSDLCFVAARVAKGVFRSRLFNATRPPGPRGSSLTFCLNRMGTDRCGQE